MVFIATTSAFQRFAPAGKGAAAQINPCTAGMVALYEGNAAEDHLQKDVTTGGHAL